jgi:hypothetical protein
MDRGAWIPWMPDSLFLLQRIILGHGKARDAEREHASECEVK